MSNILEVTYKDVEQLTYIQLTHILISLLYLEARVNHIPANGVGGSLKITVGDGGEDAHIRWTGGVERTDWLPNRYTLFQCKATDMSPSKCKKEILYTVKGSKVLRLKPEVESVLDAGGTYILFYYKGLNDSQITARIKEFRQALRDVNKGYADTADIKIYDANKIAAWVNRFIAAELQICSMVGRSVHGKIMTWEQWEKYEDFRTPYEKSPSLDAYIAALRAHYTGVRKVARIVGLCGLGKTRLALETFRPPVDAENDIVQQMRSNQVIYLDANSFSDVVNLVVQWRNNNLTGIIIVDNCGLELHQDLEKEIKRHGDSRLNLLTLDFSPEKDNGDYPFIELEPMPDEVIGGIVKHLYPGLPEADVTRIVQFAQGFPQIAVLLAQAREKDAYDIGKLNDNVLLKKLLWGRNNDDPVKKEAISACSIFEYVGFEQDLVEQRYFIADNICAMDRELFYRIIIEFKERGIIDQRHRYIRVVPQPLAVRLAADWWRSCSPEKATKIITEPMPDGMIEALCDQLAKLHFLPEAQRIIRDLCSEQAPFGQAEVLNSEKGSRLFRSLVEVNPDATAQCLYKAFGDWPIEKLLTIEDGRRNLVWSIEKLCFWENTFPVAAKMMLKFAAAETETWGNNATGQFLQLYQPLLSGTQAPPLERLKVIEYAFLQKEEEYKILAIKALGQGLRASHFSRVLGVEKQGTRPPSSDWRPKVWGEIFDYWRACLSRLEAIALGNDDGLAKLASQQIIFNLRGLVSHRLENEIKEVMVNLMRSRGQYWPEAFEKMQEIVTYELPKLPEESKVIVEEIIEVLRPKSTRELLIQKVSLSPWHNYEKRDGTYVDLAEKEAEDLAVQFVTNLEPIIDNLKILLSSEQRKGFFFGRALGERITDPASFIEACISSIKEIESSSVNPIVLCGFFAGIQNKFPDVVANTLNQLADDQQLKHLVVDLTRFIRPKREDLERVINIVGTDIASLRSFAYGNILGEVPEIDVEWFCKKILEQGTAWIALDIIYFHTLQDTARIIQFKDLQELIVISLNLEDPSVVEQLDIFHWEHTISSLLKIPNNFRCAQFVSQQLIELAAANKLDRRLDMAAQSIMAQLLSDYLQIVWPILSQALLEINAYSVYHDLIDLLRPDFDEKVNKGMIESLAPEILFEWLRDNPERAPLVAVLLFPIMVEQEGVWQLHSIIKYIIDNFGNNESVLRQISSNLGTFSWAGSLVPLYERKVKVITNLLEHPIGKVREWAEQYIEYLQSAILREKRDDEEGEIIRYKK